MDRKIKELNRTMCRNCDLEDRKKAIEIH